MVKQKQIYTKITPKIKKDVNELAKKNFIKQKIKEVIITLLSIFGIIYLPYWIGLGIYNKSEDSLETFCEGICNSFDIWLSGVLTIFCIGFCLLILGMICSMIWSIIKSIIDSNWNKAYEKAEQELNIKRKKDYWYWGNGWKKVYKNDKKNKN